MNTKVIDKQIRELTQLKKQIAKKNALFKKMTPAQRRVAIAKDALKQVSRGKWEAESRVYVTFDNLSKPEVLNTCDLTEQDCRVCARGALFLAAVHKFNDFDFSKIDNDYIGEIHSSDFGNVETRLWSEEQLEEIEFIFELSHTCGMAGDRTWNTLEFEHPELQHELKILQLLDFTPKFEYFVDLVWSREHQLGAAAHFLINHVRNLRKTNK